MSINPTVSVIVTTKNEQSHIEACLRSIKKQNYSKLEIIVVDNSSKDKTKEISSLYTKNIFDIGPERSAQRNFGARKAKGDFLLFIDADMILSPEVVGECVLAGKEFSAVVIPEKSIGKGYWASVKAFERSLYEGDSSIEAARFFSKKVFDEAGGYDEKITGPEDWDLPRRIAKNHKIGRIKSYILHDEGSASLFTLIKKKYYYGLRASRYIGKHKNLSTVTQMIYFLRPAFYKNIKRLYRSPQLAMGMIIMLFLEQIAGLAGVIVSGLSKN